MPIQITERFRQQEENEKNPKSDKSPEEGAVAESKTEKLSHIDRTIYANYKKMIKALMEKPSNPEYMDPDTNRYPEEDRKLRIAAFGKLLMGLLIKKVEAGDPRIATKFEEGKPPNVIVTEVSAADLRRRFNEEFPPEPVKTSKDRFKSWLERARAKF